METKKQAIKRLKKENEKRTLYVVTNQMENNTEGTELWNIYEDLDKALNWIWLCEDQASMHKSFANLSKFDREDYKWLMGFDRSKPLSYEFKYGTKGNDDYLFQRFIVEAI